ncbi:MAG: hypothetical protein J7L77_09575 [Clostridiales bacterium]|nr:hypothetical protein [Clostridiales bacterium]
MSTMPTQDDRITALSATPIEVVTALSDGNPGAISVLIQIINKGMEDFLSLLLLFDTHNIYGSSIWIAYKDYAKEDIDVLLEALKDCDKRSEMIKVILDNS